MRRFVGLISMVAIASAAPQEFVSPPTRTHLIELFTSEGCSSCPPAEAWLGKLRRQPGLWRDYVPVAWHVDYWDRLGWKDRFASREATQRQYAYAKAWESASVYTPCFAFDGREWRERNALGKSREAAGILRVTYDAGKVSIHFAAPQAGDYDAHAVILASGIASKVARGENRGRELHHEFVAATPPQRTPLRDGRAEIDLPPPKVSGGSEFALALWITRRGELTALQATGGWLISDRSDPDRSSPQRF